MRPDAMKAALLTILFLLPLPAAARTDSTAFRRDTAGISERANRRLRQDGAGPRS